MAQARLTASLSHLLIPSVSIAAGDGADTIGAIGVTSTTKGGSGSDSIYLTSAVTDSNISTQQDADTVQIFATASGSKIWLGSGADSLNWQLKASNITVSAGTGADTLTFALDQTSVSVVW